MVEALAACTMLRVTIAVKHRSDWRAANCVSATWTSQEQHNISRLHNAPTHLPPAPQSWPQWCRRCRRRVLRCPHHSQLEPGTAGAVFQHTLHTAGKQWAGKQGSGDPKHCL